jgi:putative PIN family toxin of toxin-antitoxin system
MRTSSGLYREDHSGHQHPCGRLTTRGLSEVVYEACVSQHDIVLCEQILEELGRHLPRVLKVTAWHAERIVSSVRAHARIVEPAAIPRDSCRDVDDLAILGTLVAANADCLVTADQGLLVLQQFHGMPILAPRGLHDLLA